MGEYNSLKYCVLGAGAIGMLTAACLGEIGKDVSLICRGDNLAAVRENGIQVQSRHGNYSVKVKAVSEEEYTDSPDVILLSIKSYSLDSLIPFLNRVCRPDTVVITCQNALDYGAEVERRMSVPCKMCSGVIYVQAVRTQPGVVKHNSVFFRLVYAPRDGVPTKALWKSRLDMLDAGIAADLQTDAVKICLRKFIRVSCIGAICCYYNDAIGVVRRDPEALALYQALCSEICAITEKRGSPFVDEAYDDAMTMALQGNPNFMPSIKRDMDAGRPMEVQTQFFDVYEMGRKLGLPMEAYGKISRHFGYKGEY
ncbi:MAG: 2-dehydropantoate 2-reductase [Oscillospiraceae bacterium]|nr:2-dehydropantoate 2-reductase [Oscillospiraceae bacterium]